MDALLKTAREEWKKFDEQRENLVKRAGELLKSGDPSRAVAELDRAPRAYFKTEAFQRVYAQCRDGVARSTKSGGGSSLLCGEAKAARPADRPTFPTGLSPRLRGQPQPIYWVRKASSKQPCAKVLFPQSCPRSQV